MFTTSESISFPAGAPVSGPPHPAILSSMKSAMISKSLSGSAAATGMAVLLVVLAGLGGACGGAGGPGSTVAGGGPDGSASVTPPPLDLRAPLDFQTASFAFG